MNRGFQNILGKLWAAISGTDGQPEDLLSTAGALNVSMQPGSTWSYGPWPMSYFLPVSGALVAGADPSTLYTSGDISNYNGFMFELAAIGGTVPVIKAYPSFNGGVNFAATPLAWLNLATGAVIAGATGLTTAGIYALLNPVGGGLKMNGLQLIESGGGAGTSTCTWRGAHVWC